LIRKIIDLVRRLWSIPFFRFLAVGGINTVFGYAVFAVFTLIGLHYVLAALLATICGILFNFKTTGTLVFKNRDNRLIFRFFGVYLITYSLMIGFLKLFDMAGVIPLVAGAIIALPLAVVSFLLMRKLVFKGFKQGLIR
jgi:putative flippase GtrA